MSNQHPAQERGPLSYCLKVGISTLPAIRDLEEAAASTHYASLSFRDVCEQLNDLDKCEDFDLDMHRDYLVLTFLKEEMIGELLQVAA